MIIKIDVEYAIGDIVYDLTGNNDRGIVIAYWIDKKEVMYRVHFYDRDVTLYGSCLSPDKHFL